MFVNGNPASHEAFQANQRAAFSGLCLAIVQSTRMYPSATNPGTIRVTAMSAGLHTHIVTVSAR
jgi:beta-galactosidase